MGFGEAKTHFSVLWSCELHSYPVAHSTSACGRGRGMNPVFLLTFNFFNFFRTGEKRRVLEGNIRFVRDRNSTYYILPRLLILIDMSFARGAARRDNWICPLCSKRVSVGIQCATCLQWFHSSAPCTQPSENNIHNLPYLCASCTAIASGVIQVSKQFPTLALQRTWGELNTSHGSNCGGDRPEVRSIRHPATLRVVQTYVGSLKRHGLSTVTAVDPERLVSAIERVAKVGGASESSSTDDDDEDLRNVELVALSEANRLAARMAKAPHGRKRFAPTRKLSHLLLLADSLEGKGPASAGAAAGGLAPSTFRAGADGTSGAAAQQQHADSVDDIVIDLSEAVGLLTAEEQTEVQRANTCNTGGGEGELERKSSVRFAFAGGKKNALKDHFESVAFGPQTSAPASSSQGKRRQEQQQQWLVEKRRQLQRRAAAVAEERQELLKSHTKKRNSAKLGVDLSAATVFDSKALPEAHRRMYFDALPPPIVSSSRDKKLLLEELDLRRGITRNGRTRTGGAAGGTKPSFIRLSQLEPVAVQRSPSMESAGVEGHHDDDENSMAIGVNMQLRDDWAAPF